MFAMAIRQPGQPAALTKTWAVQPMVSTQIPPAHAPAKFVGAAPTAATTASEVAQEQALIRAVLAGNTNAYQALVEAHQGRVYGLALRMLGNEREAEDAAQDAFVQAFTKLRSYNSDWRFKTWIMTITNNLCIDKLRRRRLEPTSFTDYAAPAQAGEDERELEFESNELPPDVVAAQNEQRKAVAALLAQLPAEDRSMVAMFYWDDMSYEDIARTTNSTVSAVKSRLFRARRALAQSGMMKVLED
jgi:RNA polymerase sigma-70 factor, ECF subfamily